MLADLYPPAFSKNIFNTPCLPVRTTIFKNVEYIYNEHYMLINHKNNEYNFSEVVYDIDKHNIKVYNNGKYIKMVEMEQ